MGRFLMHVAGSLKALGCRVIILSAKELAIAKLNNPLLKFFSRMRVPWLAIYWIYAFKVWRSAGYPLMVPTSQEWVVPFGFSKQIPIYHDLTQYFYPRHRKTALYYRYYLRWVSGKLALVYCVSNSTGRMVRRLLGGVNYRVCGVPIDREFLKRGDESTVGERFHFVWVGTLGEHKNYRGVLDYVHSIADATANVAMIISRVDVALLNHEIRARRLGERIKVFSNLSDHDLSGIYRRSETVLSTSQLEGFCMPVLEAALCGCIPVVPNRATFRENFGRFGVLVPPHDAAYSNYIKIANAKVDRQKVMEDAQALHKTICERWRISMGEITTTAVLGRTNEIIQGRQQ
jgi:glycosyltransferase involved in cell wall biosynthesis